MAYPPPVYSELIPEGYQTSPRVYPFPAFTQEMASDPVFQRQERKSPQCSPGCDKALVGKDAVTRYSSEFPRT